MSSRRRPVGIPKIGPAWHVPDVECSARHPTGFGVVRGRSRRWLLLPPPGPPGDPCRDAGSGVGRIPAVAHDPADDRKNTDWEPIIATAKSWVEAQPYPVTLRQCFYHLVATQEIKENTVYRYTNLSKLTSDARWIDEFPDFSDESHSIYELGSWSDIEDYAEDAALGLTLDRTMGQEYQVVVGVEKRGMRAQASRLFSKRGWKIVPLGGYGSTTIKKRLVAAMKEDGRPSLLLYAGDFDASGEDIQRDFEDRVPFDLPTVKVALSLDQVREYGLPESFGKESDTRSEQFARKYGTNLQVEVDALDPAELDRLMIEAAAPYWDESRWDTVMAEEEEAQQQIREALERL